MRQNSRNAAQPFTRAGGIDSRGHQQHRLGGNHRAETLQLFHDHSIVFNGVAAGLLSGVDQVKQQAGSLHMLKEPCAQPSSQMGASIKPGISAMTNECSSSIGTTPRHGSRVVKG